MGTSTKFLLLVRYCQTIGFDDGNSNRIYWHWLRRFKLIQIKSNIALHKTWHASLGCLGVGYKGPTVKLSNKSCSRCRFAPSIWIGDLAASFEAVGQPRIQIIPMGRRSLLTRIWADLINRGSLATTLWTRCSVDLIATTVHWCWKTGDGPCCSGIIHEICSVLTPRRGYQRRINRILFIAPNTRPCFCGPVCLK